LSLGLYLQEKRRLILVSLANRLRNARANLYAVMQLSTVKVAKAVPVAMDKWPPASSTPANASKGFCHLVNGKAASKSSRTTSRLCEPTPALQCDCARPMNASEHLRLVST